MGRVDYRRCKDCGASAEEVGELSHQRLCTDCGHRRRSEAALDLANHTGPYFKNWRRGVAASVGGVLLDDNRPDA